MPLTCKRCGRRFTYPTDARLHQADCLRNNPLTTDTVFPPAGHSLVERHWEVRREVRPAGGTPHISEDSRQKLLAAGTTRHTDPTSAKATALKLATVQHKDYTGTVAVVCVRTVEEELLVIDAEKALEVISGLGK